MGEVERVTLPPEQNVVADPAAIATVGQATVNCAL
jgi:hypothetical protein